MDLSLFDAIKAYGNKAVTPAGATAKTEEPQTGFKMMVEEALDNTADATAKAETASIQSVAGDGDMVDMVTAVSNAEMVVETVVAVRDRVIQAYNDIIRMPI